MKCREARRMIRVVFFDFDGVLTTDETGSLTTLRSLSQATGIELSRLRDAFAEHNNDLNLGRVTHADIWPTVCRKLGTQIDISLLLGAFESTPLNENMIRLASTLKRQYLVGMITDNKADRIAHLKTYAKLSAVFDPIVVSAEVGSDKKTSRIFEIALGHHRVPPCESLFIDNTERNLVAPRALGMNTIYFDAKANDLDGLKATLQKEYEIRISRDA
jgi:FMN phosphatase YigB (HAD superfamily)